MKSRVWEKSSAWLPAMEFLFLKCSTLTLGGVAWTFSSPESAPWDQVLLPGQLKQFSLLFVSAGPWSSLMVWRVLLFYKNSGFSFQEGSCRKKKKKKSQQTPAILEHLHAACQCLIEAHSKTLMTTSELCCGFALP